MDRNRIRTIEDAYVYMVGCQLATVDRLSRLKSRRAHDYSRQIGIAQIGIDTIKKFNLNQDDFRIKRVFELGGSVNVYADSYDVKKEVR